MREKLLEREGEALGNDEGWETVARKKKQQSKEARGRVDVATNAWKIPYKDTFSFYFSEFPETHGAKEMLKAFQLYGEAMEVVIPPKRDKWGKRFGFVRFCKVGDPRLFAIKLDNIIFGAKKIHVNVPRFQREWNTGPNPQKFQRQREKLQRTEPQKTQQRRVQQVWKKKDGNGEGGRKVEGQETKNQWKTNHHNNGRHVAKIVYHRKNNLAEICYNVSEEEMERCRKMYVGTVRTPGSTYAVQEWFNMQGFFLVKITPLGANKVLMEEMEEGVLSTLMKEYKDWLYEKFDDIRGWDPDMTDNERVVWVRCHGIPTHAWNDDFFASLARNFGEYLGVDVATRTKAGMDVARIMLRSHGYDVFNAVVTANINGSLFPIKMIEEWCGPLQWVDSCCKKCCQNYGDSDDSSDSGDSHGDLPPLFTVEEEWCSNEEEEVGDGEGESEYEEGNDDDVSKVQETVEVQEEFRCNNCDNGGEKVHTINDVVEKENINDGRIVKVGEVERDQVEREGCNLTHGNNDVEHGGAHSENNMNLITEGENHEVGCSSNIGGCEEQRKDIIDEGGSEKKKRWGWRV